MPRDDGFNDNRKYPFVGIPITITVPKTGSKTMSFVGGDLKVEIYTGATSAQNAGNLVQTLNLNFPDGTFPVPDLVLTGTPAQVSTAPASIDTSKENWWTFSANGAMPNFKGRLYGVSRSPGSDTKPEEGSFIRAEDVVRSIQPYHGDYRLVAGKAIVAKTVFTKHQNYDIQTSKLAHGLVEAVGKKYTQGADANGKLVPDDAATHDAVTYAWGQLPDVPYLNPSSTVQDVLNSRIRLTRGDWDTGMTTISDGAYINKPDEGNNYRGPTKTELPYYDHNETQQSGGQTFFSPNRQIPSAVMFGSLPTGLWADNGVGRSWRTLLFRPDPTGAHDGWKTNPRDHLILDLFWMPVVEPYAISEPFSTAGKVNLNYQISPFSYIKRTTALRALLRSERVTAIGTNQGNVYKGTNTANYRYEIDADETLKQFDTRFSAPNNKPFKSASEICEIYLVPKDPASGKAVETVATMPAYWLKKNALTGDNLREHPYATLYPRLTTKSNVFSVHYCVQTLKQIKRGTPNWTVWDETKDAIVGEARGTTVIERYVDLQDPTLPDFATLPADSTETLDKHCKLRVLMNRPLHPLKKPMKTRSLKNTAAFSLVEICLAIGIVAFAFVGVVGLLPAGMDTFRQSMNTSIGSQIIQRVVTEAQQTDFKVLIGGEDPQSKYYEFTDVRYFDEQGNELAAADSKKSIYHVHVVVNNTPLFPNDGGGSNVGMNDVANVTVQVAVNPGQKAIAKDASTFLWNPSPADPQNFVPVRSQSVMVANHD